MSSIVIDEEAIRKLADLLKETGLNEIEYTEGEKRIRCVSQAVPQASSAAAVPAAPAPEAIASAPEAPGTPVEAPMVGTVYLSPEPHAAPFVKLGSQVAAGDTLLIIEAMKVMNPIKAPIAGTVAAILTSDAKPVEFGDILMRIV